MKCPFSRKVESRKWKVVNDLNKLVTSYLLPTLHGLSTTLLFPPSIESRAEDHTPYGECHSDQEINHIMVPQVDGGKNESTDNREKEIEEEFFIAMGQV